MNELSINYVFERVRRTVLNLDNFSMCCKSFIVLIAVFIILFPSSVYSFCSDCQIDVDDSRGDIWEDAERGFDNAIDRSFRRLQNFIIKDIWERSILPVMMLSAEQFTAVAMQQAMIIGMFIDAESQMKAQLLLQEIRARAHKDYHPSVGMCEFGSVMKSLAASERKGEITAIVLSQRSQDRQLGQRDSSGMYGHELEMFSRIEHFKGKFCNVKDRGGALKYPPPVPAGLTAFVSLCSSGVMWDNNDFGKDERNKLNKDIDYFSLVDSPWSLNIDFTNKENLTVSGSSTPVEVGILDVDEENILAMASNLYAHDNFPRIPARLLRNEPDRGLNLMQKAYMDMRSIIAKRSVAENSFYAIAAMKSEGNKATSPSGGGGCKLVSASSSGGSTTSTTSGGGSSSSTTTTSVGSGSGTTGGANCSGVGSDGSPSSDPVSGSIGGPPNSRVYMEHILKELGMPSDDILQILGENPSYFAQMEIITKKMYQNPDFYTNLYDKPANIERKTAAMQAIKLMQKFDMLKSFLRNEMATSILLELAVVDLQKEIEDQVQVIGVGGN